MRQNDGQGKSRFPLGITTDRLFQSQIALPKPRPTMPTRREFLKEGSQIATLATACSANPLLFAQAAAGQAAPKPAPRPDEMTMNSAPQPEHYPPPDFGPPPTSLPPE